MSVESKDGRATVYDEISKVTIIIASKFAVLPGLFFMAWLGGWTVGGFTAFKEVLLGPVSGGPKAFMIFWLMGWAVGELTVFAILLWMAFGREVIEVDRTLLTIGRYLAGMGFPKEYAVNSIDKLRVDPNLGYPYNNYFTTWGRPWQGGGLIAFTYGAKTIRFGAGLDEAEAGLIVKRILARFPATQ